MSMGRGGPGELLHEETDELFDIGVGKTPDERYLRPRQREQGLDRVRLVADADIGADRPFALRIVFARRADVEYTSDHRAGSFYVRINDTGRNFRLVTVDAASPTSTAPSR